MTAVGRNDPCPCGSGKKHKQCCMRLAGSEASSSRLHMPGSIDATMQTAMAHHQAGRLPQAEAAYAQVLRASPNHADALHYLGMIAHQTGRNDMAVELMRRAIGTRPSFQMHFNLGLVLQAQGKASDALASYGESVALKPDFAPAHLHLGGMYKALGKLDRAEEHYRKALAIDSALVEAHGNLGNLLALRGRLDAAIESYRRALSLRPSFADAHLNLGNALVAQDRLDEAETSYRQALAISPNDAEAHVGLGSVLLSQGLPERALEVVGPMRFGETPDARTLIGRCIVALEEVPLDPGFRRLLVRAIAEPWGRPSQFAPIAARLLRRDATVGPCIERAMDAWPERLRAPELFSSPGIDAVADDELLRCLLQNTPASEIGLERLLTMARLALLDAATAHAPDDALNERLLRFYCALAQQCFINEYVYSRTDDENARAEDLRARVMEALRSAEGSREAARPPGVLEIAAVAAYFPLLTVPGIEALLDRSWPNALAALLAQQVREPLIERQYRSAIPRLTTIDDETSRVVRQHYEESPYPRWVKAPLGGNRTTVDAYLLREFSLPPPQYAGDPDAVEILIAGCGTGRHSIQTAQAFIGASVLAVDLSLASLCYAKRKTAELGLGNVEYAHADLLQLGSLERNFDIVESHGVLHHLADPMQGWRVLHSLLRPGGFMSIGLYSELARQDIVAARDLIAARGYRADPEGIRRCREDLFADASGRFDRLVASDDFYSTSSCRDLVFHAMEHRFTIPRIKQCLDELGLEFLGFRLEPRAMLLARDRFADVGARTNLDDWNAFESEFPHAFRGMYQFWARKPA